MVVHTMMMEIELPDLSHLTKEEQEQILSVIKRQKDEEQKEKAMKKTLQVQFENYKQQVKLASENASSTVNHSPEGTKGDSQICSLCKKTQIAEGCGHTCSYCTVKFCSRCGGRVAIKSSKNERMAMWVCNDCRTQQDLLTKTGTRRRGEQSKLPLTLSLEPLSENDTNRLPTSSSLAHFDRKRHGKVGASLAASAKLKKGSSVPQLAQCETASEVVVARKPSSGNDDQVFEGKSTKAKEDRFSRDGANAEAVNASPTKAVQDSTETSTESSSSVNQGIRRSSTNSEKRLHRQHQAVTTSDVISAIKEQEPSSSSKSAESTSLPSSGLERKAEPLLSEQLSSRAAADSTTHERVQMQSSSHGNALSERGLCNGGSDAFSSSADNQAIRERYPGDNRLRKVAVSDLPLAASNSSHRSPRANDMGSNPSGSGPTYHRSKPHTPVGSSTPQRATYTSRKAGAHSYSSLPFRSRNDSNPTTNTFHSTAHDRSTPHFVNPEEPYHGGRRKHNRGYMSDDETPTFSQRSCSSPSSSRERGHDQVPSYPCRPPAEQKTPHCSCQHASQPGRTARFISADDVSEMRLHRADDTVYHSDVNLSRNWRPYPYEPPCLYHGIVRHDPRLHVDPLQMTVQKNLKSTAGKHVSRKPSLSSTDDELLTTPNYSSCDETDNSKNLQVDEKGRVNQFKSVESGYHSTGSIGHVTDKCSVAWQPSSDNTFLIGRMVLNKNPGPQTGMAPNPVLGIKVVGGKQTAAGHLGAFITRVKKGSIAEKVGHLKPGDEVIMWNNCRLRGASFNEVYEAVLASKDEKLISLVVSRPIKDVPRIPEGRQQHPVAESSSSSFDSQKREDDITAAHSHSHRHLQLPADVSSTAQHKRDFPGKLQVRIYFDVFIQKLFVTAMRAIELPLRKTTNRPRCAYIKMYLLPDRSNLSKRRTKVAKKSCNPVWNQTLIYPHVRRQDLDSLSLQLTVWDLEKLENANQSRFLGEVFIDLGLSRVDDVPQWYKLMPAGERMNRVSDPNHKLPPSSAARIPRASGSSPALHISPCASNPLDHHPRYPYPSHLHTDHRPLWTSATAHNFSSSEQPLLRHHDDMSRMTSDGRAQESPATSSPAHQLHLEQEKPIHSTNRSAESHAPNCPRSHQASEHHGNRPMSPSTKTFRQVDEHRPDAAKGALATTQKRSSSEPCPKEFKPPPRTAESSITSIDGLGENLDGPSALTALGSNRTSSSTVHSHNSEGDLLKSSSSQKVHDKSKTLSPKTASKRPKTKASPSSQSKSTPPNRRSNAFGKKLTGLVGMKSRSQSSTALEGDKSKTSTRCSEFGIKADLQREGSRDSASGSLPSVASESSSCVDKTLQNFIGGLGPGQIVGRQTLATSSLGELQLGLFDRRGYLEVNVMRARNLTQKSSKLLPAISVKVYLMYNLKVVAKKRTKVARRSYDPVFDQTLVFEPNQYGNSLQLVLFGEYRRLEQKDFMGVVQIRHESLKITNQIVGWYKLFPTTSLADTSSFAAGQRAASMTSLEQEIASGRS